MLYGIDFSSGGGLTTAQIRSGGKSFVCRYLSGGNPKDIDVPELASYKAAGIPVVFVWEVDGIMRGESQGTSDAHAAQAELDTLAKGVGESSVSQAVVFFAADAEKMPDLPGYMSAVKRVLGLSRVGIYGGIGSVSAAFDAGLAKYGWQTLAWSGGRWDGRALLRQVVNNVAFGPAEVDLDQAAFWGSSKILTLADNFGQWPAPGETAAGPYWHAVPAGNTQTLDGLAADRNTTMQALVTLTVANTDPANAAVIRAYLALDNACVAAGHQRPSMPAGMVYYTVNP